MMRRHFFIGAAALPFALAAGEAAVAKSTAPIFEAPIPPAFLLQFAPRDRSRLVQAQAELNHRRSAALAMLNARAQ